MAPVTSVKLVFPSEIKLIDLVHEAAEKMAGIAGFDSEDSLNVGLAVREAVINAIRHGNREDPALKVSLTLTADRHGLKAKVVDRGNGFDPGQATDPTDPSNLLNTGGRGLLLIRAFVDRVDVRRPARGGTEVVLVKRRAS